MHSRPKLVARIPENQTTGLLWLDEHLRLQYFNPAAGTLLGLDSRRCLGAKLADCLPHAPALVAIVIRAHRSGEILTQRELRLTLGPTQAQRQLTVDCTATPVTEHDGANELLVELVSLDRHLRISREQALTSRSDANRALARSLAHEIKNPLGGVRGAAQLLARRLTDDKLLEYTRIIVAETDRLAALVDTMLGPLQPTQRKSVNVHEVVEHVARLTEAAGSAHLEIARDYDPSLPELKLDRDQIIQALLNLAKNAREALGKRGRITFRTRALRQFTLNGERHRLVACVDVTDNGPGIAMPLQPWLFSPLVSDKPTGAGLGLAIAQELVNRHGGLIECSSQPGNTVFSILLPMDA